jgi:hypothetical protein
MSTRQELQEAMQPPADPPKQCTIVFETGATRCDIGNAEFYLISPTAIKRIARMANSHPAQGGGPKDHVNRSVGLIFNFLSYGQDRNSSYDTKWLERAALEVMHAIDPDFQPNTKDCLRYSYTVENYNLLPAKAIRRVAEAFGEGAKKYAAYNWEKGMPAHAMLNHAIDHAWKYFSGDETEDHLGHMLWNLFTSIHSLYAWDSLNKGKFRRAGGVPKE